MSSRNRRSRTSSRAVQRLEPYNKSPAGRPHSRSRHGSSAESSREIEQTPATAEDPPSWAKELLQQQKEYGKELKRIKSELDSAKRSKQEKPGDKEPEFKFEGNKKQYRLNKDVLGKISTAMDTSDDEERKNVLLEGETLLWNVTNIFVSQISMGGTL